MEPKLPMPSPSPEMGGYQRQETQPIAPERAFQRNAEAQPNSAERGEVQQQQGPAEPIVVPATPAQPFLPAPQNGQVAASQPMSDTPLMASDDDLIEKEWVEKAKKIIQETRSDPYTQEREVSRLQADYIKKRYGKDVKLPSE